MRDAPREPRELPSQMRSKAPHTIFFFQLKHAGNSTQLANLAGRCRRQTSSEAISIQKGPRTEGPDIRFIASSARKEGHLMWPSSCAGLPEQAIKYIAGAGPNWSRTIRAGNLIPLGLSRSNLSLRQRNTAKPAPAHARASAVEPNERVKRPRRDGALVTHNDAAANVDAHVAIDQARYAGTAMR